MLRGLEHSATLKARRGPCSSELRKDKQGQWRCRSKAVEGQSDHQRFHAEADRDTPDATGAGKFIRGKAPIWTESDIFVAPYTLR